MPRIVFTPQMCTGIEAIDADHRRLVAVVNELSDDIEAGSYVGRVGPTLAALIGYAEEHFAREEQLMLRCRYDGLERHMAEHHQFSLRVYELQGQYVLDPKTVELPVVLAFLDGWLSHHILETDMAYVPAVKARRQDPVRGWGRSSLD